MASVPVDRKVRQRAPGSAPTRQVRNDHEGENISWPTLRILQGAAS